MRNPYYTLNEEATVKDALKLFVDTRIHRAAVLDGEQQIVGVLTQSQLLKHLFEASLSAHPKLQYVTVPSPTLQPNKSTTHIHTHTERERESRAERWYV